MLVTHIMYIWYIWVHMGYIWPCKVQGHFGTIEHVECSCLKMASKPKRMPVEQILKLGFKKTSTTYVGYICGLRVSV